MAKRRVSRRGAYRMTPARRTALRKAQMASARKRKGHGKIKVAAAVAGTVALTGGALYARHRISGSSFGKQINSHINTQGNLSGSRPAHFSFGKETKGTGRVIARTASFTTRKQGPLGHSVTYGYRHIPLRLGGSRNITGTRINKEWIPRYNPAARESWVHGRYPGPPLVNVNGGIKTGGRAGVLVSIKPVTGASIPSKVIGWGHYERKLPKSTPKVNIDRRMRAISKRHGL